MHKIREITVGVCYVDSILEKAEEAVCKYCKKRAVKKRRMKDLHRLQKNCFAKRWLQARSVCTIH